LKIRDRKPVSQLEETIEIDEKPVAAVSPEAAREEAELAAKLPVMEEETETKQQKKVRLTFGQSLMEKVKKFFEEVE
jgi:cell division protein FtsA